MSTCDVDFRVTKGELYEHTCMFSTIVVSADKRIIHVDNYKLYKIGNQP